jgi:plasmid stabilization system protein ParE
MQKCFLNGHDLTGQSPISPPYVRLEKRYRYSLVYEVDETSDVVRILRVLHPRRQR